MRGHGANAATGGAERLRTDRFVLRRFGTGDADADALVRLDADPAIRRYTGGGPAPTRAEIEAGPLARILAWHERSRDLGYWWIHDVREHVGGGADESDPRHALGWVHLRPVTWAADPHASDPGQELELGWRLHRRAWGRGAATETAAALVRDAFDRLGAPRVVAVAMPDNDASLRVMERLGLRFRECRTMHGALRCVVYAATAMDRSAAPRRIRVRPAEAGDREAIGRLLQAGTAADRAAATDASLRIVAEGAAVADGRGGPVGAAPILGIAAARPGGFAGAGGLLIGPVVVDPPARGRAVGARLVRGLLARAAELGFTGAAVPPIGEPAAAPEWFARFGFAPADDGGAVRAAAWTRTIERCRESGGA